MRQGIAVLILFLGAALALAGCSGMGQPDARAGQPSSAPMLGSGGSGGGGGGGGGGGY